jgi:hypothetical protein
MTSVSQFALHTLLAGDGANNIAVITRESSK